MVAIARIVAALLIGAGVCLLLLADAFGGLAALSDSFISLKRSALTAGAASAGVGAALGAALELAALRREKSARCPRTSGLPAMPAAGDEESATRPRTPGLPAEPATRGKEPAASPARRPALRFLRLAAGGFALGWIAYVAVIYAVQDDLVFSPSGLSESRLQRIAREYPHAEPVEIAAADGAVLRGWLLPPAAATATSARTAGPREKAPLVLVFAGQGGEASRYFALTRMLPDLAWAFINYRGYGASDGSPSDRALFSDAVAVYDALAARPDIDAGNIFAFGGSLGTGVATYLAARRPLAGVVLFSPYDSIGSGVARDMFRWAPAGLLIRHRFDAAAYAPAATAPVLAVVGDNDAVIRPARSYALLDRWGGERQLVVVPGGDHYSIYKSEDAWRAVRRFVNEQLARPRQAGLR